MCWEGVCNTLESDYREMYVSEGLELIDAINKALLKLEDEPDVSEHIDSIFRFVHSLKGMAATMDYEQTRELCYNIENIFDDLRKGRTKLSIDLINALFRCVDALQHMILDENKKIEIQPFIAMLERPDETKIIDVEPTAKPNSPTIRVKISDIDSLANLVGEISIFKTKIENLVGKADSDESQNLMRELERFVIDLRHQITKIRLVPIEQIFSRFTRLVRDTSASLGKQIDLHMDSSGIEIDRTVLEAITYPLLHILRNCIDHGLEKPDERVASGKSSTGNVYLMAYNMGDKIGIKIQDDGRGINLKKVKEVAVQNGIISSDKARQMSAEEIIGLIGTPGLTTSQKVTDISGRGVGMDVVIKQIQEVGGSVKIDTELGKGTTITLMVPLALTLESGALIR
jgi:two-component system chemotaxis sensor kinase CheA